MRFDAQEYAGRDYDFARTRNRDVTRDVGRRSADGAAGLIANRAARPGGGMKTGLTAGGGMLLGLVFGAAFGHVALGMIFGLLFGAAVAAKRRSRAAKSN